MISKLGFPLGCPVNILAGTSAVKFVLNLKVQSSKSRKQKWSASTENDDVFELEQSPPRLPSAPSSPSPEPVPKEVVLLKQKQPRNHRYTYSEYLALRNQGDQHLVAITPLMQTNQHLQSQHFRMSQSIKEMVRSLSRF